MRFISKFHFHWKFLRRNWIAILIGYICGIIISVLGTVFLIFGDKIAPFLTSVVPYIGIVLGIEIILLTSYFQFESRKSLKILFTNDDISL